MQKERGLTSNIMTNNQNYDKIYTFLETNFLEVEV